MRTKIASVVCELVVAVCAIVGVWGNNFLYFTTQSNLWIGIVCLGFAIKQIVGMIAPKLARIPVWARRMKFVFTVSITLTGAVFCVVLAPVYKGAFSDPVNVITHIVVPLFAVIDLLISERERLGGVSIVWSLVPPVYYLAFATVGFMLNWNFGGGNNYPYFFLNWGSSVGAFGIGGEGVYFLGTFWWILIMIVIVCAIAAIYLAVIKRLASGKRGNSSSQSKDEDRA